MLSLNKIRSFVILILLVTSLKYYCVSQRIFLGFPTEQFVLDTSCIIYITPLPWTQDGHFDFHFDSYFNSLKNFMLKNSKFKFELYLNAGTSNKRFNYNLTEYQTKKLDEYLKKDSSFIKKVNYILIPSGDDRRLFINDSSNIKDVTKEKIYETINSRLEIHLVNP